MLKIAEDKLDSVFQRFGFFFNLCHAIARSICQVTYSVYGICMLAVPKDGMKVIIPIATRPLC